MASIAFVSAASLDERRGGSAEFAAYFDALPYAANVRADWTMAPGRAAQWVDAEQIIARFFSGGGAAPRALGGGGAAPTADALLAMPFDAALAASAALRGFFIGRADAAWRGAWGPGAPPAIRRKLDDILGAAVAPAPAVPDFRHAAAAGVVGPDEDCDDGRMPSPQAGGAPLPPGLAPINESGSPQLGFDVRSQREWFAFWDRDGDGVLGLVELREAIEDYTPEYATAVRNWLEDNWRDWAGVGAGRSDGCGAEAFISTGCARALAERLQGLKGGLAPPPLLADGDVPSRMAWFDYYDTSKEGALDKGEVTAAVLRDPRYKWERAMAAQCVEQLWSDVAEPQVDKRAFALQGGLADLLVELLDSELGSAADWLREKRPEDFTGKDCGICFCEIEKEEKCRQFECGCLLHLECVGEALKVLIKERRVSDDDMKACPAQCGTDFTNPIGPGVVRAAVSDDLFDKYLNNRLELEWAEQKENKEMLIAECPDCRFLTVCKEAADMLSVKCCRKSCPRDRFCARCGDAPHKPHTCEEQKRRKGGLDRDEELRMIQQLGFQRCPRCGDGGELQSGCKWMMCTCGGKYCYHCGRDLPHPEQHYHHWWGNEGPFGKKCVGGKIDNKKQLAIPMVKGTEVEPRECPQCTGWSFGKTDCAKCKNWQFENKEVAPPPAAEAAKPKPAPKAPRAPAAQPPQRPAPPPVRAAPVQRKKERNKGCQQQ